MGNGRCKMALYVGLACVGGFLLAREIVRQVRLRDPVTHANELIDRCRGKISAIEQSLSAAATAVQQVPS